MALIKDAIKESLVGTTTGPQLTAEISSNFLKHAAADEEGEPFMGLEQFLNAVAPADEDYHKIKREHYSVLFQVADRRKTGQIRLADWATFENLLAKPDADYSILFRLFDTEGTGSIPQDAFQKIYTQHKGAESIPFDFNSEWASLYIGGRKKRHGMTYEQFAQMMRGLQGERIRQAFHLFDKDGDGYIEPEDFQRIILQTAKHKLSDHLLENLPTLCNISPGTKISYANVRAFQNIIREMDLVDLIVRSAVSKSGDGKITRTDFLDEAARLTRFSSYTPMEADILFHFASLDNASGRLGLGDFAKVIDASWQTPSSDTDSNLASAGKDIVQRLAESAYHFGLGAVAGAFGAFMVYPIDLVKTRMQNQRNPRVGERLYKNSLDCAQKVFRNEGLRGLYSGVLPQLIGVAPEKAIKLTVNDLVRGRLADKDTGALRYPLELVAGGTAGACQVVFTNPLEIVKIRLQVQGELLKKGDPRVGERRGAVWIMQNLGVRGLYKGASACLLRDVPFSAIYFPAYAHLKKDVFGESPQKKLGVLQLLTAGAIAGMPAAYLTTPCDVIKTRLQVEARKGEVAYKGLTDCAKQILRDEGFKAFFKGGPARIMRSSPQFGFTLASYEVLQNLFPMSSGAETEARKSAAGRVSPGIGLKEAKAPLPYLRSRNAMKIILDLDQNFGQVRMPVGADGALKGLEKAMR